MPYSKCFDGLGLETEQNSAKKGIANARKKMLKNKLTKDEEIQLFE